MSSFRRAVDPKQIAESVLKEFGLRGTVSAATDPDDSTLWHLKIRDAATARDKYVAVDCGPNASPLSVRRSIKRQLNLET
jgi:hypothetical protein